MRAEGERAMLFITEYQLNPHMPKAEVKRLMDEFGARGAAAGEVAHYVRADGTGGYTVSENDDLTAAYADVLAYHEFMTFTITPVLTIDDAVGPIMTYLS
jgi:Protein of unknown function (DUF3303)